jgi:hypothetical protein
VKSYGIPHFIWKKSLSFSKFPATSEQLAEKITTVFRHVIIMVLVLRNYEYKVHINGSEYAAHTDMY